MRQSTFLAAVLAAALATGPGTAAAAPAKRVPASQAEAELSFAPLVKRAAPAVVNIYTKRVVRTRRSPFFNDPFFRQFFGGQSFGRPRLRIENSLGSGVIVRPEGIVVTNNHVIDKADQITVVLADSRELDAEVILADERTDLAVLRLKSRGEKLPYLEFRNSDELEVGDLVLAIGNPFGVGQTVTSGIISALARAAEGLSDFSSFIQTDAAINPGNSGGALISMDGRLAGINTAIFSRSGGSQGIGFAIPSNMVATVVDSALKGGKVVRPWFGAAGQAITTDVAASLGLTRPVGVLISRVFPGGPAARAGLLVGDAVIAVNGREVADTRALKFRLATLGVGGTATLEVVRRQRAMTLKLSLARAPERPPRNLTGLKGRHPLAGATVANLSPALAVELSLDSMQTGVIVLHVVRGSLANRFGMRPGDVVIRVNRTKIGNVRTLKGAVRRRAPRWTIVIRRDGKVLSMVIEG
jgi:serine protease Do